MSKFAVVAALLAGAGLVAWNLTLSAEVGDLRDRLEDRDAPAPAPKAAGGSGTTPAGRDGKETSARTVQRIADLESRLAEVEHRSAPPADSERATAPAELSPTGPDAAAPPADMAASDLATLPEPYRSEAFRTAVGAVLDARDEQRRLERQRRTAENLSRAWLRDLTVTDAQREDVVRLAQASLQKVEDVRGDESLSDEQKRAEVQRLGEQRIESLTTVLDAQQMEVVRQRANLRFRQGPADAPAAAPERGPRIRPRDGAPRREDGR